MTIVCPNCQASNGPAALFCSHCGAAFARGGGEVAFHGERRQLTALFCDIVNSTAMAKALDPEEYHDVIRAFARCCTAAIRLFEGHMAELRGDGALVFFGYPRSHGDEPERAIRAALGIIDAVGETVMARGAPLQVRIGIATGVVAIDESILNRPTIVGEAVIMAARLQEIAEPDTVVISQLTLSLAGDFFEVADLGAHELKGFAKPAQAWRVTGAKTMPNRFKALHHAGQSAFVGRVREWRVIMDAWQLARRGNGRVVAVSGEAGIGKSRLIRHVRDSLREVALTVEYFCSPYHATTAFYPVIDRIARANFRPDDTVEQRIDALRAMLAAAGPEHEVYLPWLATLMSLPDNGATQSGTPQQRKQKILEALFWWVAGCARKNPLVLVVEDAHWSDPTSIELQEIFVERVATIPVLMIVSVRPPFDSAWMHHRNVIRLRLDRLDDGEAGAIVAGIARPTQLPQAMVDRILEKTDGIPLFIEEVTKMVLGAADPGDGRASADALAANELPATLKDSLSARLDQLGPDKHVAQCAAVVGREFRYDVLSAVSSLPPDTLESSLARLIDAGLVLAKGTEPHARYLFKHAMMRDAAYDGLLRRDRRRLHAAVASALERLSPAQARQEPELLAYHYTEADLVPQALKYWGIAALRAIQRSANLEAIVHTTKAFELLATLPDTRERRVHELGLRFLSGGALWAAKGFASLEVERTFLRAQELAAEVGEPAQAVVALRGLFGCYYARGELTRAQAQGEAVKAVAQRNGSRGDLTVGHMEVGSILFWRGELEAARAELETALSLYDPAEQRAKLLSTQIDPGANARYHLSWTLWTLGLPDQALASADRAVAAGREIAQPLTLAMALFWRAVVKLCRGDIAAAAADTAELRAVTTEFHIRYLGATTTVLEGALLIEQDQLQAGVRRIEQAFAEFEHQNAGLGRPWMMALVAGGYLRAGMMAEGLGAIEQGFAAVGLHGEAHWEAELHRLKAELLFVRPASVPCEAQACVRAALSVARGQGARSLELRAISSLSRMAAGAETRAMLADLLGRFTEGFATRDLMDATRLAQASDAGEARLRVPTCGPLSGAWAD
jgi:class 3 adenylate cyclase/tetratricopeptide (TPR) repeat protein